MFVVRLIRSRFALKGSWPWLFEPLVDVVVVELFAPEHAGQGLPHDVGLIGVELAGNDFGNSSASRSLGEDLLELSAARVAGLSFALTIAAGSGHLAGRGIRQPQAESFRSRRPPRTRDSGATPSCRDAPGSRPRSARGRRIVVDAVFHIGGRAIRRAE